MSTKSTIFLTDNNEHWYHDCSYPEEINIEIDRKNCNVEINEEDIFIYIKRGSHLYNIIYNAIIDDKSNKVTDEDIKYMKDFNEEYGKVEISSK